MPDLIYTIGHSTRTIEDFVSLLRQFSITHLVDVRHFPRSRHNPQFNTEDLAQQLPTLGLAYLHLPELGGRRPHKPNSLNLAWQNEAFRGYADYMDTPEFQAGLETLIEMAREAQVCIMCAEVLPWRCHRRLIADALLARGLEVLHIIDAKHQQSHTLTPWAVASDGRVTYPVQSPG
ncbi:MAG: DUF488 domain-containing protein [Armatimonadota bacterium]